jgi:hypothetical protein
VALNTTVETASPVWDLWACRSTSFNWCEWPWQWKEQSLIRTFPVNKLGLLWQSEGRLLWWWRYFEAGRLQHWNRHGQVLLMDHSSYPTNQLRYRSFVHLDCFLSGASTILSRVLRSANLKHIRSILLQDHRRKTLPIFSGFCAFWAVLRTAPCCYTFLLLWFRSVPSTRPSPQIITTRKHYRPDVKVRQVDCPFIVSPHPVLNSICKWITQFDFARDSCFPSIPERYRSPRCENDIVLVMSVDSSGFFCKCHRLQQWWCLLGVFQFDCRSNDIK